MKLEVKKMELIEGLLLIQDKRSLEEIGKLIQNSISLSRKEKSIAAKVQSFEKWNSQFKTSRFELNEKIPEMGLTLLEFRKKIYESEFNKKTVNFNDFKKELKSWKRKKSVQ